MTYTATSATMHSGHDIRDERGSMVAIVHNPASNPTEGARIAALMAAAPEMLAALQGAIETADGTAGMSEAWWYAPARVAIARAIVHNPKAAIAKARADAYAALDAAYAAALDAANATLDAANAAYDAANAAAYAAYAAAYAALDARAQGATP